MNSSSTGALRIAFAHPALGFGGSEAKMLWGVAALRGAYDLCVVTGSPFDSERLNTHSGTELVRGDFHTLVAPQWPRRLIGHTDALRCAVFARFLRSISHGFDICMSGYNPMDFGKPAVQFIADFSFDDALCREHDPLPPGSHAWAHRAGPQRRAYLKVASMVAGRSRYDGRDDLLVANSQWTASVLRSRCGMRIDRVIYPPVVANASGVPWERRENGFTILGRVSREKRIEKAIDILAGVRALGHDVHLHVIGPIGDDAYGALVRRKISDNAGWCIAEGGRAGDEKLRLMSMHRYAIHGRDREAFGIAVAEQVKAGCIPFVPDSGGPVEIVDNPDLCYRDEADAVAKIDAVLRSEARQQLLREHLARQAKRFGTDLFMREIRATVEEFAETRRIRARDA